MVSEGEEEAADSSRETLEQSCEQAREQLTNSIRLQWRKLKSHMARLDSQGRTCGCLASNADEKDEFYGDHGCSMLVPASLVACQERESEDQISRREHEEEIQRMRLEVQQCKDFIHMQQQLLQVYT